MPAANDDEPQQADAYSGRTQRCGRGYSHLERYKYAYKVPEHVYRKTDTFPVHLGLDHAPRAQHGMRAGPTRASSALGTRRYTCAGSGALRFVGPEA